MFKESYELSETFLIDNIVFMRQCRDNQYDVGVVDPEYLHLSENGNDKQKIGGRLIKSSASFTDFSGRPTAEYFYHLFRITRYQFIFGGNYFTAELDKDDCPYLQPNNNWFVWYKQIAEAKWSMAELAWTSIDCPLRVFKKTPMGDVADWHPTSKPLAVYRFIYKTYLERIAKELNRRPHILDTNLGSGTSRQAAWEMKFPFTGLEINEKFYKLERMDFDLYRQSKGYLLKPGDNDIIFDLNAL
jgi:site-specific DNA-methyltransferase (adenine-specific)